MKDYLSRMPVSLANHAQGEKVHRILNAALEAVDPAVCVESAMTRCGDTLLLDGRTYKLSDYRRAFVVGMGKAALSMAEAVAGILAEAFTVGIIVVKEGYGLRNLETVSAPKLRVFEAAHPVPDERGVDATRQILDLVSELTSEDLVICVVSGGGSALFTSPRKGLSLNDLQNVTSLLLGCGATINEINTLRKCLDEVKGGGLARLVAPAQLVSLILSDVVGDPLDVIASGPCVTNSAAPADAAKVLEKYALLEKVPGSVRTFLSRAEQEFSPGLDPVSERVQNVVVGSNRLAAQAALRQAEKEGFNTLLLTTYLQGEARVVGGVLAAVLRQVASDGQPVARPACIVAGGETTVTLVGDGFGGRNQEVGLAAVPCLAGLSDVLLLTLATDGGDGPTDAAGAVVSGETLERAQAHALDTQDYLARNDSYHYFNDLGDLIHTGATRTNVNDLDFLFAF